MIVNILFIVALGIPTIPVALSQSTSDATICHFCAFCGYVDKDLTGFQLTVPDLPERCNAVAYGNYFLDAESNNGANMFTADEDALRSLVAAKKYCVFTYVSYFGTKQWNEIFDPTDQDLYNQRTCPLIQKIKDLGIDGIVLELDELYTGTAADYDATKISTFVQKMKEDLPALKFAITINAFSSYNKITNKELFDFTVTNSAVDWYFIDMFVRGLSCDEVIMNTGTLIKSPNANDITLEVLSNAVAQSALDKAKIVADVDVSILRPIETGTTAATYSQYCNSSNAGEVCNWCEDDTQKLYDEGAFLKNTFHGIMSAFLDYDDFQGLCECKKFPGTNAVFDGWDGVPVTACSKMDLK